MIKLFCFITGSSNTTSESFTRGGDCLSRLTKKSFKVALEEVTASENHLNEGLHAVGALQDELSHLLSLPLHIQLVGDREGWCTHLTLHVEQEDVVLELLCQLRLVLAFMLGLDRQDITIVKGQRRLDDVEDSLKLVIDVDSEATQSHDRKVTIFLPRLCRCLGASCRLYL